MTRPLLLLTRPQGDAARTAAAARAAGFATLSAPLMAIRATAPALPPETAGHDALLFTSANAPALVAGSWLARLPAHAVGARTARAARAAGFRVVATGAGDGTAALQLAAAAGARRVLHPGGEAISPIEMPAGVRLERLTVYRTEPVAALPARAVRALGEGKVGATLLFSAKTAALFRALAESAGLDPARLRIVGLSPAVVSAAGPGWACAAAASAPNLPSMLAAARGLWQEGP